MDELYLDNIDEFVNDHNKIVTYKWLSLTLGVHVNTAKQMLFHYLDQKRKESGAPLHATFLVSGKLVENGQASHKVSLVREEQLDDFKSRMSVLVSVHVYSVQKALLKDSGPLYSVDYDAVKDNLKDCSRFSAIRCADAVPLSSVELQQSRQTPEPQNKKACVNGDAGLTPKPPKKPPKGIMGMFASKTIAKVQNRDKDREQKEDVDAVGLVAAETPQIKTAGKSSSVSNFFGLQTAKKQEKSVKIDEESPSSPNRTQQYQPSPEPEDGQEVATESKDTKKDCRSKTKRVESSDSDEEKMEKKKRRRIKKPEPDSSDDDDVIPDSPQRPQTREPTPCLRKEAESVSHKLPDIKVRKRRRVLKTRTFVDEEGCIVTEKGYESESYSETEADVPETKDVPRDIVSPKKLHPGDETTSHKKPASNKGTKQASIMGFFQKK